MTRWIRKPEYVETVVIPNNEFGDHPMHDWPEVPDWLQKAFDDHLIRPRFGGEDYWYYDVVAGGRTYPGKPGDIIIRESDGVIRLIRYDTLTDQYNPIQPEEEKPRVPVYLPRASGLTDPALIGTASFDYNGHTLNISVDIPNDFDSRLLVTHRLLHGALAVTFIENQGQPEQ